MIFFSFELVVVSGHRDYFPFIFIFVLLGTRRGEWSSIVALPTNGFVIFLK